MSEGINAKYAVSCVDVELRSTEFFANKRLILFVPAEVSSSQTNCFSFPTLVEILDRLNSIMQFCSINFMLENSVVWLVESITLNEARYRLLFKCLVLSLLFCVSSTGLYVGMPVEGFIVRALFL